MTAEQRPDAATTAAFRPIAALLIAIAAGIHAAALLGAVPLQSANDRSRWATVWALVDRGTFAIDAIDADPDWSTIDKVQQDGRLYSTKPALLTVLAGGAYAAIRSTLGWSIYADPALVTRTILTILNLIPWLGALAAVASFAGRYATTAFGRTALLATAAFGTYLSTYSVTFNNHTVAAVSLIFALHFALRIVAEGSRSRWDFALCGLTSSFVTTNELPAAVFGLAMFVLLLRHDARRTLLVFVPAALIPVAAFVLTTWLQTGSWKPFYMSYGTSKYVYIRDGLPSYWANPRGIDRNLDSPPVYLLHCLVGHHGIVSLSPIFVLTVVSWIRAWRRPAEPYRPFLWMGLGLTVFLLAFYLSRTSNYNYGGNTVALRWALWLVPFWLIALLPTLDEFAHRRWFRWMTALLLAVSTFSAWESIANPWQPSWLYTLMEKARWIDYRDHPPPVPSEMSLWFPTLPPAGSEPKQEWIELTAATGDGPATLRLELIRNDPQRPEFRLTQVEVQGDASRSTSVAATIDRTAFDAGAAPGDFVLSAEPTKAAALALLQRLPRAVDFRPGPERMMTLPVRELAFRTQQVSATIDVRRSPQRVVRHRIDVWLSDDVPFGVVRLRETLSSARSGERYEQRDYLLTNAGRLDDPDWAKAIRELESSGGGSD